MTTLDSLDAWPKPGEAHPWYADKLAIRAAVTGTTPPTQLQVVVLGAARVETLDAQTEITDNTIMLAMRKARIAAPWAGRMAWDVYYVGIDQYGRYVASEVTERVYEPVFDALMRGWSP